jgi:hypothetical protein
VLAGWGKILMKNCLLSFFMLICLMSCKTIIIKDGKVPSEILTQIKKYEGIYKGSFQTTASQIEIRFDNDVPQLIYTDEFGHEILDEKCHSKIGKLERLILLDEPNRIFTSQAVFAFDPGACTEVKGRQVILSIKDKNNFRLEIFSEERQTMKCGSGSCQTSNTFIYLEGRYSR